MAEGTKLEIVSPERLLLSETVKSVTVPGTDGYFTVLGDHAPLMTTLKPGFVTVVRNDGISHVYYVRGGFADVNAEGMTILAEHASEYLESVHQNLWGLGPAAPSLSKTKEKAWPFWARLFLWYQ